MCTSCGCSDTTGVRIDNVPMSGTSTALPGAGLGLPVHQRHTHTHAGQVHAHRHHGEDEHPHHAHTHDHHHDHDHEHAHHEHPHLEHRHEGGGTGRIIRVEEDILRKNGLLAERNRGWLAGRQVFAVNLMSSPGAGKTALLERTLRECEAQSAVIEGDQATANDADRIRATGSDVVQINTGNGCHLDAEMLAHGLHKLQPRANSLLFIENVGNLVCPALFDLGEAARVVIFSVTEGEDKPAKYPHMFQSADVVLLSKIDLLPYVDFNLDKALTQIASVNPRALVMQLSTRSGVGLTAWYDWLRTCLPASTGERVIA